MLDLNVILAEADKRYSNAKWGNPNQDEIRSEQVKALAATLVIAINRELDNADTSCRLRSGRTALSRLPMASGIPFGSPVDPPRHKIIQVEGGESRVECNLPDCSICSPRDAADERSFGMTD